MPDYLTRPVPHASFGMRLQLSRLRAGLSIIYVATKLGVSRETIHSWEHETKRPHDQLGMIEQWANLTRTDPCWLAFGDGIHGPATAHSAPMTGSVRIQEAETNVAMRVASKGS